MGKLVKLKKYIYLIILISFLFSINSYIYLFDLTVTENNVVYSMNFEEFSKYLTRNLFFEYNRYPLASDGYTYITRGFAPDEPIIYKWCNKHFSIFTDSCKLCNKETPFKILFSIEIPLDNLESKSNIEIREFNQEFLKEK